ncbi:alpha/beta fold hydrolase [Pseudonocardia bannensis]|uniref:Alpha/beta fold hydrolase n=1 Tax=Pseudonocardia bannensis TaxID=630973 RepID=A0A848DDG9_9PSEU|nr:alpha/beta fold hydrolase [Pseudonocardia bannensis]NMH90650.1 alpha/beta fold hydrolase [Pseudonocardia bannensis]
MPFAVTPDGTRLYFEEIGEGEPLLLVSGQGLDHGFWDPIRDGFAAAHRVVVYDHRGTGRSDVPHDPPYTTRGMAADAVAVLDHLGIPRAHVYGHSMGGRIAQWLGIDHGDRLGGLVLGGTTPGKAHGVRRPAAVTAAFVRPPRDEEDALAKWGPLFFTSEWAAAHADLVRALFVDNPLSASARRLHYGASEGHDSWAELPRIGVPTLVLHGDEDVLNLPGNAELLAGRIPGAELRMLPGAGHGYPFEFEAEATRVVLDFLSRHRLDRAG